MAAQELRWLTYLLTDLREAPRSPPVLFVDNKAMLALCQELRLEHITKHIALRYFLARELQQRGQLRLAYVASQANTADVLTKALQPCDHQPCFAFLDWSWGQPSGATATVAIVSGWTVTVAAVGDSRAILDTTGGGVTPLSLDHRFEVSEDECNRVLKEGGQLARLRTFDGTQLGPLRSWPGGLCVSRSIGDVDCGTFITPLPHVKQIQVGARGVWRGVEGCGGVWRGVYTHCVRVWEAMCTVARSSRRYRMSGRSRWVMSGGCGGVSIHCVFTSGCGAREGVSCWCVGW
ncbi:unnamed protein product [Closterium sp. NIES-53]